VEDKKCRSDEVEVELVVATVDSCRSLSGDKVVEDKKCRSDEVEVELVVATVDSCRSLSGDVTAIGTAIPDDYDDVTAIGTAIPDDYDDVTDTAASNTVVSSGITDTQSRYHQEVRVVQSAEDGQSQIAASTPLLWESALSSALLTLHQPAEQKHVVEPSRGGYEYHFVDTPPDMFVCKICHHPSREPYLSVCCGHTFCKSCLDGPSLCVSCPMCREQPFTTVPNKQNKRAINSLQIYCINREKGCNWKGEVSNASDHLENSSGCQFEDVICYNQCGATFERWYLLEHTQTCPRRMVVCQHCGVAGEFQIIEGNHKEACPKFPLSCPNSCGVIEIFREDIKSHRNICPLEEVSCSQQCGIILQRQSLASHVETECSRRKVECQYCHINGEHQFIEENHKDECPKFPLPCPNACEVLSLPRESLKEHRNICPMEVVKCEYYSVGCKANIIRRDQKIHETEKMEEHLSLTKSKLACLESTFEAKLKVLETQLEQKIQFINDMLFKNVFWTKTLNTQALQTSLDVISNKSLPLILKISDYTKHMREGSIKCTIEHYIKQPVASGIRRGYYHSANNLIRLQLNLYSTSQGDSSHLSVYFCATNTRSRNTLTTISGNGKYLKLKLEVLNQIDDSEHHSVSSNIYIGDLTEENKKQNWNNDCFISNDILCNSSTATCQYLRDDCIFCRLQYSLTFCSLF